MEKNHYAVMRKNILASMILVPIIPFILVLIIAYSYFTSSIENNTVSSMSRIVGDHRQMIESFLKERRANLEFILSSHSFEDISRPEKLRELFDLLEQQSST